MWNPFKNRRDRLALAAVHAAEARAAEHTAFLDALQAVVQVVTVTADANRAQSEVFHEWLTMFKTTDAPSRWVNDDLSELIQQQDRAQNLVDRGYPVELDATGQAHWVAQQMDRAIHG